MDEMKDYEKTEELLDELKELLADEEAEGNEKDVKLLEKAVALLEEVCADEREEMGAELPAEHIKEDIDEFKDLENKVKGMREKDEATLEEKPKHGLHVAIKIGKLSDDELKKHLEKAQDESY